MKPPPPPFRASSLEEMQRSVPIGRDDDDKNQDWRHAYHRPKKEAVQINAYHILARFIRTRGVFTTSQWIILLQIAGRGERGIVRSAIAEACGMQCSSLNHSMKIFRKAGLVEEKQLRTRGKAMLATITPKGLEVLGLAPTPQTPNVLAALP